MRGLRRFVIFWLKRSVSFLFMSTCVAMLIALLRHHAPTEPIDTKPVSTEDAVTSSQVVSDSVNKPMTHSTTRQYSRTRCSWKMPDKMEITTFERAEDPYPPEKLSFKFRSFGRSAYVFSAYFDTRNLEQPYARMMVMARKPTDTNCLVQPSGSLMWFQTETVWLDVDYRNDHGAVRTYLVTCLLPVPQNTECLQLISEVVLRTTELNGEISLPVALLTIDHTTAPLVEIGICFPPLYGQEYQPEQIAEIVELNRIFGAELFQFYIYPRVHPKLADLMAAFETSIPGVNAVVRRWSVPMKPLQVWQYGQMLAMHDCLYSMMSRARLVLFVDYDQLLVPVIPSMNSWAPILQRHLTSSTGSLHFDTHYVEKQVNTSLVSDAPLKRYNFTETNMSKYMVVPRKIVSVDVHHVAQLYDAFNGKTVNVNSKYLSLYHFQSCHRVRQNCGETKNETKLLEYRNEVRQRLTLYDKLL